MAWLIWGRACVQLAHYLCDRHARPWVAEKITHHGNGMIRAHLATFPARIGILFETLDSICPQVDQVFIVLNEFTQLPAQLRGYDNITAVIPGRDLKDTGKSLSLRMTKTSSSR